MSDKRAVKPKAKTARPRKMRIKMVKNYAPEGKQDQTFAPFLDGLGRLPKGAMVELPKKLADHLIAQKIAEKPETDIL